MTMNLSLQINQAGAWRKILDLDPASSDLELMEAVAAITRLAPKAKLRVVDGYLCLDYFEGGVRVKNPYSRDDDEGDAA
jgi:hypothetical protein